MKEKTRVKIDIRAFAAQLFQEGGLDPLTPSDENPSEEWKTGRAKDEGKNSEEPTELNLSMLVVSERLELELFGQVGAIYERGELSHIQITKRTRRPLNEALADAYPAYNAQLEISAWIYCRQFDKEKIALDLAYIERKDGESILFSSSRTCEELEAKYGPALASYLAWLDGNEAFRLNLLMELEAFRFPFSTFRSGQKELARAVFGAIRDSRVLFLEAPTGIGKTMATLYPALKALGRGYGAKVFYLTAKNSGAAAAESALTLIGETLPHLRWISLTAKGKICFVAGEGAQTETTFSGGPRRPPCRSCPYGNAYYAKAKAALAEASGLTAFTRPVVEELAKRFGVCPYELSLDISLYCDIVIADYNYVFDYSARLQRYFSHGKTDFILLVDEAHNLVDRARAMYSGVLAKRRVLEVRRKAAKPEKAILSKLNAALLSFRKSVEKEGGHVKSEPPFQAAEALARTLDALDVLLETPKGLSEAVLDFYWEARRLRLVLDHYDSGYRTLVSVSASDFRLEFLCVNPGPQLDAALGDQRAAVLFSATLRPAPYFRKLIAPATDAGFLALPSPFPPENCAQFLYPLSTRYTERAGNIDLYAAIVRATFAAAAGNLLVFSPSFAFQRALIARLEAGGEKKDAWIIQKTSMPKNDKAAFIAAFNGEGVRAFAVAGGSFAESVDLIGNKLIGTIIFGLGLPQLNAINEIYRAYFETAYGDGFDWAYLFPGINRVLQAAGRVIRSESDRGFILLVDERYPACRRLLPEHWRPVTLNNTEQLYERLAAFMLQ